MAIWACSTERNPADEASCYRAEQVTAAAFSNRNDRAARVASLLKTKKRATQGPRVFDLAKKRIRRS